MPVIASTLNSRFRLKLSLQNMSNRPADLLEEQAIKNIFAP
jgi:hypothetical protein